VKQFNPLGLDPVKRRYGFGAGRFLSLPDFKTALLVIVTGAALAVAEPSNTQTSAPHPSFELLTHRMDVDGAPNAYGPPGKPTLDVLVNAHPTGDEGSLHLLQDLGYPFHNGKSESVTQPDIVIRFYPDSNPYHRFFFTQAALDESAAKIGLSREFSSVRASSRAQ
jgi:hypothetical protein